MSWVVATILFPLFILGMVYGIVRYQFGHAEAARRLLIVGAGLAVSTVGILAMRMLPEGRQDQFWIGFYWILSFVYWWLFFRQLQRRKEAGAVLMDLKPPRGRKVFVVVITVGSICSLLGAVMSFLGSG